MRNINSVVSILFQLFLTYTTLFLIYLVYALLDLDDFDMITEITFLIFQPMAGFLLISTTVGICLLAGLPIRLIRRTNQWWLKRPLLPIIGVLVGLLLLILAYSPKFTETKEIILNEETVNKEIPNTIISVSGWFLTAFSLLHFYPHSLTPLFRRIKENLIARKHTDVQRQHSNRSKE